jgi:hypothetical protein
MHSAVLRTCAAVVFLSFAVIFHTPQNASQDPPASEAPSNERVWLAVEEQPRGRLRIEPIATVNESNLTPVQTSCLSGDQTPEDFAAKYLQVGRKYTLLFGGAPIGEGQLGEKNRDSTTANLTYTGTVKIRGQVRALATNAERSDFRVAFRERATIEQRVGALALAREIFSEHGIPEALLPNVRAEYVTRTYLAPSRSQPDWVFLPRYWRQRRSCSHPIFCREPARREAHSGTPVVTPFRNGNRRGAPSFRGSRRPLRKRAR